VRPREQATKRILAGVIPIGRAVLQEHNFFIETLPLNVSVKTCFTFTITEEMSETNGYRVGLYLPQRILSGFLVVL
jgi:hypothetical protein